jgi:hypothetical protein
MSYVEKRLIKHDDLDLTSIADPNAHASRHASGGADPIGSNVRLYNTGTAAESNNLRAFA